MWRCVSNDPIGLSNISRGSLEGLSTLVPRVVFFCMVFFQGVVELFPTKSSLENKYIDFKLINNAACLTRIFVILSAPKVTPYGHASSLATLRAPRVSRPGGSPALGHAVPAAPSCRRRRASWAASQPAAHAPPPRAL